MQMERRTNMSDGLFIGMFFCDVNQKVYVDPSPHLHMLLCNVPSIVVNDHHILDIVQVCI